MCLQTILDFILDIAGRTYFVLHQAKNMSVFVTLREKPLFESERSRAERSLFLGLHVFISGDLVRSSRFVVL